ncbi:phospholipase D family protein [Rouxiella silvae]|uniref:phospholipase D family nuclease n=1 Tax=Rouxiella silvae TaxID=1646373 RepID=UPI0039F0B124
MKKKFLFMISLSLIPLSVFAEPSVSVGFSPEGTAHELVLNVINSAHETLRVMAYSFTDQDIVKALIAAKNRGVDVRIVVDEKGNRDQYSQYAMEDVTRAGIPLRTDSDFAIQHDKTMVVDNVSVETGSYNFTSSAAKRNSENAVYIQDLPSLANQYLLHWQDRWNRGKDYN